ncbi:hypothetical protein ACIQXD_14415 [Streptomyces uncialis]|uniref:hypothetical protein n=1 Tax=Streptomyces uncialis TaxID=1048205 RepID=UPI0037F25B3E
MEMRTCSTCTESKPLEEFHKDGKGGRKGQCAQCRNLDRKEARKVNPAPHITNRTPASERMRATAKALGITSEEFTTARMRPCEACGQEAGPDKPNTGMVNPETGTFAGTVCLSCAKGFAFLKKDPRIVRALLAMLDKHLLT